MIETSWIWISINIDQYLEPTKLLWRRKGGNLISIFQLITDIRRTLNYCSKLSITIVNILAQRNQPSSVTYFYQLFLFKKMSCCRTSPKSFKFFILPFYWFIHPHTKINMLDRRKRNIQIACRDSNSSK